MTDTVADTPGPLVASPEQNSIAIEPTMDDTALEKNKDGHVPTSVDAFTDGAATNDMVTNDLVNFDMGSTVDAGLPVEMTEQRSDFDMLGSVNTGVKSPVSQQADSMLYSSAIPNESSSSLLVDLNMDSDLHDASTASLTSQSPANECDPFDSLQLSAEKSYCSGVDLANEMSAEPATAGLVQPIVPDAQSDLQCVADNENFDSVNQVDNHGDDNMDVNLPYESNDPNSVLPPAGTAEEEAQPSMEEQNISLIISEPGDSEKDVEVSLMSNISEELTDHLPPADVTRLEGQDDHEQLHDGTETQRVVADDSKENNNASSVLPLNETPAEMQPMETGSVITGGEERSEVKEQPSKPAEETVETISETPEMPLHLMAVSRHIVSEVQENAFASLETLEGAAVKPDSPPIPEESAGKQVEQVVEPVGSDDKSPVAMETPAVADNEAVLENKTATMAEKAEPIVKEETSTDIVKEKSIKNDSTVTETKKTSSGSVKSPRNRSTPGAKKSQLVPPTSATKKTAVKKQAVSSASSTRSRSAKKDGTSDSGIEEDKGNHSRKSTAGSAAQTTPVSTPKHKSNVSARKPGGATLTSAKTNGSSTKPISPRVTAAPSIGRSPNMAAAKSRIGSLENSQHTPGGGNVKIFSKKENFSTVSSRCGSKDNIKHHAAGGDKKIESKKLDWKVQSKVGSLDNSRHRPGGGTRKVETQKLEWKAASKVGSMDNARHKAGGGERKIEQRKLEWNVESKVGSLDNATHKAGGGTKKIESRKLDFKEKAQSKVGSKDNIQHKAEGGDKKIEVRKLEWNVESKVGSLDNAAHKAGGGTKKIEIRKLEWNVESKVGSLDNATHKAGGGTKKIETQKLTFKEKAQSKVGSKDNIQHKPSGGDKKIETQKVDFANRAEARTDSGVANGTSPKTGQ